MTHPSLSFKRTAMNVAMACILSLAPVSSYCLAQGAGQNEPLVIEEIQCRGNQTTSCNFIVSHLYLSTGDVVDEEEIQNAEIRLASLSNFQTVDIHLERGSVRGSALIVIDVEESNPVFTEWAVGTSARLSSVSELVAGRVSHQNVFGSGKILDLTVSGRIPVDEPTHRGVVAQIRYADPHLLDSKRYFALASVLYADTRDEDKYGSYGEQDRTRIGVSVGRRLWDFSYLTIGYGYQASLNARSGHWQNDGTFETETHSNRHAIDVIYGWNSEDDFYFPTRGSAFHIGFGWDFGSDDEENALHAQFRKTWSTAGNGLWSIKVGGEPISEHRQSFNESQLLSVMYARPIAIEESAGIGRGRWYVEPGISPAGFAPGGRSILEVGLKAGVRLEIASFGLVDLYVIGSSE